ncbi:MAG: neuraminidase-like domain-containing protein [Bacteroidota bacterium]
MAKYILLRFFPKKPVDPSLSPNEFDELMGNGSFSVNLYDLSFSSPTNGTLIHTISYNDLTLHDAVLASVVVDVTSLFTGEYESKDLRVEITRNGSVILDKVFNFNILTFDLAPGAQYKKPSLYIPIPIPEDSLSSASLDLPNDGSPPSLANLKSAVNAVISANGGSTPIENLTLDEIRFISKELAWAQGENDPPRPNNLKKLYKNPDAEDKEARVQMRSQWESELQGYYAQAEGIAKQITQYIVAAKYAIINQKSSKEVKEVLFRFPLRPGTTDVNKVRELAVILYSANTSGLGDTLEVTDDYFYSVGAEMPINMDADVRFEALISESSAVLLEKFKYAKEKGYISASPTDSAGNVVNDFMAIRRLHALHISNRNIPSCDVDSNPDLLAILNDWSDDSNESLDTFWDGLTPAQKEYHADLVTCVITNDNTYLRTEIDPAISEVADFENPSITADTWSTWFTDAENAYLTDITNNPNGELLDLDFIPDNLTTAERAIIFANYAQQFFNIQGNGSSFSPTVIASTPPTFGQLGPIENYINAYGLDPTQVLNFTPFQGDECAQAWLKEKIEQLAFLHSLTSTLTYDDDNNPNTPEVPLQIVFSIHEALFARGFVSVDTMSNCTLDEFKAALSGTVAYGYAEDLFLSNLLIQNCSLLASDPNLLADVISYLQSENILTPADIVSLSITDFSNLILDKFTNLDICVDDIYAAADANPSPNPVPIFTPINNGNLINCIPTTSQSPTSTAVYLQHLLQLTSESSCDDPFVGNNLLYDQIKLRRGELLDLEVSSSNLESCIPYIDIVNENLEALVVSPNGGGVALNNPINDWNGHNLSGEDAHDLDAFFEAIPTNFSSDAADILSTDFSASILPYHHALDTLESYLACLGTNRFQMMRKFRKNIHEFAFNPDLSQFDPNADTPFRAHSLRYPVAEELALAFLGITQSEKDFLLANPNLPNNNALQLYGFDPSNPPAQWEDIARNVSYFLESTGLSYCELYELQKATENWNYVSFTVGTNLLATFPLGECEPPNLQVLNIFFTPSNNTGLKRIIVFIRLWQKLKDCFSIAQFRDICEELNLLTSGQIHVDLVRKLAAFKMLHQTFGLPLSNTETSSGVGVHRTNILAIWKDQAWINANASNQALHTWALKTFIESIERYAKTRFKGMYEDEAFTELLPEQLSSISILAGFDDAPSNDTWNDCPTKSIRFADFLSKFMASSFSYGEFMWLFANQEIAGDNPFNILSTSNAVCFPFDLPNNQNEFSLDALRQKLCDISVSEEELAEWNWNKIESVFQEAFCLEDNNTALLEFAKKFLPNTLSSNGHYVSDMDRRLSVSVPSNSHLWNTTEPQTPFNYNSVSHELWYELPLNPHQVYEKLSRIRHLDATEQQAVQDLIYAPYALLAPISFLFEDFSATRLNLIEEREEDKRWQFFKEQFVLCYKRMNCIAEFLATFTNTITCTENAEGKAIAWKILKHLFADENFPTSGSWQDANAVIPSVNWSNPPNGGAFSALLGTLGTGLKCEYFSLDGSLIWRDIASTTNLFGDAESQWNVATSALIPSIAHQTSTAYASIRNGFALNNSDGAYLGGAEGFHIKCGGVLVIDEGGKYTFMAGQSSPEGEAPLFEADMMQAWKVTLSKEQKIWQVLGHNWDGIVAPSHQSHPIKLQAGAYDICIAFIQPEPNFDDPNKICPQLTGFQLKYSGADTEESLITIPTKHLFLNKKKEGLEEGLSLTGQPLTYLETYYPVSIHDIQNTYQRAVKSMLLAYRLCLSAEANGDDGSSELDFMLSNGQCFKGYSYNFNGNEYEEHEVIFNFNNLGVIDTYCPDNNDPRSQPSIDRQRALADLFELLYDYKYIKDKSKTAPEPNAWKAIKELAEDHPDGIIHLLRHLGVDASLSSLVLNYDQGVSLDEKDLKDINWILRVCENAVCLEQMQCLFPFKNIQDAIPALWAAKEDDLEQGIENLTQIIRDSLIETTPRRYKALKQINDGIRLRYREAMVTYLTRMSRVAISSQNFASSSQELSEWLLMDVEIGLCQKMSRIEAAVSAFQRFVQQAKLGLEPSFIPNDTFNQLWKQKMGTYQAWKKCQEREIYAENWIKYEKLEEARKSEGFQLLEERLDDQTLTIPASGGATVLSSPKPPTYPGLKLLQSRENSTITPLSTISGLNLIGIPATYSNTWLSAENATLPYWVRAAVRLGVPFIRIAAASLPPASITHKCDDSACCSDCGEVHDPMMDEYYFSLIDAKVYKEIEQEVDWYQDPDNMLSDLLSMETEPIVYLVAVKQHNTRFSAAFRSSEYIIVNGTANLNFQGRVADSLEFKIDGAVDMDQSFWFHLVDCSFDVLPKIDVSIPTNQSLNNWNLGSYPYFAYFDSGAALFPKSHFSTAIAVAENLKMHCQYEEALRWLELEIKPLEEDNTWTNDGTEEEYCRKALLLKYLDILNCWGEALMRQNTGESIQQASLIFQTAKKILGDCPKTIHQKEDLYNIQTLKDLWIENKNLNPSLLCIHQEIENNYYLIQDCINAHNLSNQKLKPAFGSLSNNVCKAGDKNCLSEMLWCLPPSPYQFQFLLSKALELANQVSSFGASLLAALEKCDTEMIANIQEAQSKQVLDLSRSIREQQARESNWNRQSTEISLDLAYNQLTYHQTLIASGLISEENDYLNFTDQSMVSRAIAQTIETSAQPIKLTTDSFAGPFPLLQLPVGSKLADFFISGAKIANILATIQSTRSSKRATEASWERRLQEWQQRVVEINFEIDNLKRQLRAADLRERIALQEANNHALQMQQAEETLIFLREKFTNQELYQWMKQELTGLYYQFYECALKYAHQAQQAYNFECSDTPENFLRLPVWDNLYKGLLAGEQLQIALRRMEKSYLDKNVRTYELSKNISFRQFASHAFLQLITTGICMLELPEWLFDQDHPGHYNRKIVSVSISIPSVVGTYTNINAKLTLLKSKIRVSPVLACDSSSCCDEDHNSTYLAQVDDNRFVHYYGAKEAMVTSKAQNDSGVRRVDMNSDRYLWFQCSGVISTWCLELPEENNYFDLCTITDAIFHVQYDAKEGGQLLSQAAQAEARKHLPDDGSKLLDLKHEMPHEWHKLETAMKEEEKENHFLLQLGRNHFLFIPLKPQLHINRLELFFEPCEALDCKHYEIGLVLNPDEYSIHPDECDILPITCVQHGGYGCLYHGVIDLDAIPISEKGMTDIGSLIFPNEIKCLEKAYVIVGYDKEEQTTACTK